MSSKNSRHTPSPSPSSPSTNVPSKLPKFLQKQNRDKSKTITDNGGSPSTSSLASGSSSSTSPEPFPISKPRKTSKFLGIKDKDKEEKARKSSDIPTSDRTPNHVSPSGEMDEPPVIIEPVAIPRPRTRSERPANSAPEAHHTPLYSSASSTSRIGDLPTRLSGWFSHTFSTSSTDLSLPSLLAQQTSPKGKGPSALLSAARHGKGHLDKAMRYILDPDATPDKCTDPIWLLGVRHPGYEPPPPTVVPGARNVSPASLRSSTSSVASSNNHELSQSTGSNKHANPAANWPPEFYTDFTSRIWLTYRNQFPLPLKDVRLGDLCGDNWQIVATSPATVKTRPWNWGGEKIWTSDSGWGCMLRTGQSLLANALVHMHLGREWRSPPYPLLTADYATYAQILTWFLDTPAPEAPFSVHRMALAGKELGTDVGQWFGPSVAAGAIRTLVNSFPECGLGVSVATDSTLYRSQVYAASHGDTSSRSPRRRYTTTWGDRPVLLLLGIRLGIEGVNPIYYETIKLLYTFPQSVGIAGGRPSSSYYFVGSQADNLFYLDPHNARPAIPLRTPPQQDDNAESDSENVRGHRQHGSSSSNPQAPVSPSSIRTSSSNFSYHAPVSPSPLQQQFSSSSTDSSSGYHHARPPPPAYQQPPRHGRWRSASASSPSSPRISTSDMDHRDLGGYDPVTPVGNDSGLDPMQLHFCTAYSASELKTFHCDRVRKMPLSGLDPSMLIGFLCRSEADWCDFRNRVADLPKTIFSVQEEPPSWPSDSDDNMGLESISEPDDLDLDYEEEEEEVLVEGDAMEDDEEEGVDDEDEVEADAEPEQFFDTRSGSASTSSVSAASHRDDGQEDALMARKNRSRRSQSEEIDTEEDPVDPLTPGPGSKFDIIEMPSSLRKGRSGGGGAYLDGEDDDKEDGVTFDDDDIVDDWVEPSIPTPTPVTRHDTLVPPPVPVKDRDYSKSSSSSKLPRASKPKPSSSSSSKPKDKPRKSSRRQMTQQPVPVPPVRVEEHYPFPVTPIMDDPASAQDERPRSSSNKGKRMHTARARDGGRTQSGGVKGILTDDLDQASSGVRRS